MIVAVYVYGSLVYKAGTPSTDPTSLTTAAATLPGTTASPTIATTTTASFIASSSTSINTAEKAEPTLNADTTKAVPRNVTVVTETENATVTQTSAKANNARGRMIGGTGGGTRAREVAL